MEQVKLRQFLSLKGVSVLPNSKDQGPVHQSPERREALRKSVEQSIENIKSKTLDALRQESLQSPPSTFPVRWVKELHSQVDLLALTAQQSSGAFACAVGCSTCCQVRVEVTPPEVFLIASHLLSEPEVRRSDLIDELTNRAESKESEMSKRHACALLVDGRCSVYAVRPAACRKGHSYDAVACKEGCAELPLHYGFVLGAEVWMAGVAKGYEAASFQSPTLELGQALLKVLLNPQMQSEWLAGRSVF